MNNFFLKSIALLMIFSLAVPLSAFAEDIKFKNNHETGFTGDFKSEPLVELSKQKTTQAKSSHLDSDSPDSNQADISYFVPEKRIAITAEITDPAGIKLARCYFRAAGEADYVFVPMSKQEETKYTAILPAPAATTQALDFTVLAVNTYGAVVKSNPVIVPVKLDKHIPTPVYQQVSSLEIIQAKTELAQAPQVVKGFAETLSVEAVEPSVRFMYLSGVAASTGSTVNSIAVSDVSQSIETAPVTTTIDSPTVVGIKSSTFKWIAAGVALLIVGATLAVVKSGGSGGGSTKSGSIAVHWW